MLSAPLHDPSQALFVPDAFNLKNRQKCRPGLVRLNTKWSRKIVCAVLYGDSCFDIAKKRPAINPGTPFALEDERVTLVPATASNVIISDRGGMPDEKHTLIVRIRPHESHGGSSGFYRMMGWVNYDPAYYIRNDIAQRYWGIYDGSWGSADSVITDVYEYHNLGFRIENGAQSYFRAGHADGTSTRPVALDPTDDLVFNSGLSKTWYLSGLILFQGLLSDAEMRAITKDFWGSILRPVIPGVLWPVAGGVVPETGLLTVGANAGAMIGGLAAGFGTLAVSAQAAAGQVGQSGKLGALTMAAQAGESMSGLAGAVANLEAGAIADEALFALATAAGAVIAGANAGDAWVGAVGAGEVVSLTVAAQAGASFAAAAIAYGALTGATTAAEAISATTAALASLAVDADAGDQFVPVSSAEGNNVLRGAIQLQAALRGKAEITPSLRGLPNTRPH